MKCETCKYFKMCRLGVRYMEVIELIAEITDTHEPDYSRACKTISGLFDGCIHYEEKA